MVAQCLSNADCDGMLVENPCQTTICHPALQSCVTVDIPDGSPCVLDNLCVTESICTGGVCVPSSRESTLKCDDGNFCTNDSCDPDIGCVFAPLDAGICDDGNDCTEGDYCDDGVCISGIDICPAQCGNGVCQESKGETCGTCSLDCGPCSSGCTTSTFPGCGGCGCEACVCAIQPECCTGPWNEQCAFLCVENCGVAQSGCESGSVPGCCGCGCETCVCDKHPECCTDAWTDVCIAACATECDGTCATYCGDGTCSDNETCDTCTEDCGVCPATGCEARPEPGCDGCACESCVCELAPGCCESAWSSLCATACQSECGSNCEANSPGGTK